MRTPKHFENCGCESINLQFNVAECFSNLALQVMFSNFAVGVHGGLLWTAEDVDAYGKYSRAVHTVERVTANGRLRRRFAADPDAGFFSDWAIYCFRASVGQYTPLREFTRRGQWDV